MGASDEPPRRVLIVRPSALGDVSRTVPVAASIKAKWPGAEVHWLVNAGFEPVVAAHPAVDRVVPFDRKGLSRFGVSVAATRRGLAFARSLRDAGYDRVYDAQGLARSGLVTRLTGAPRRVGFHDARELGWLGSNVRHRVDPSIRHTVDRMLALIEADGVEPVRDLSLRLRDQDAAWVERFIGEQGLGGGYLCVAPTARWASKCWPPDRFGEVAARVLEARPAWKAVVLGSPSERTQARPCVDALAARGMALHGPAARVLTPETGVGELAALLARCDGLICNDSAPLHIAAGFDRRIVGVFGPTDPAEVGPYRRDDAVVRADASPEEYARFARDRDDRSLIERVGVDAVWRRWLDQTIDPKSRG